MLSKILFLEVSRSLFLLLVCLEAFHYRLLSKQEDLYGEDFTIKKNHHNGNLSWTFKHCVYGLNIDDFTRLSSVLTTKNIRCLWIFNAFMENRRLSIC